MKTKLALVVPILLLAMFSLAVTVSANTPDPGGGGAVDMNDPAVVEALAKRYVAGERLTPEETQAAVRYVTVASA